MLQCDDCMVIARPWDKGRAALIYKDKGRSLVLGLKHGDRTDLAIPAAGWMARVGEMILSPDTVLVPVPLHWTRLLRRRYNQSAALARELARITGLAQHPDRWSPFSHHDWRKLVYRNPGHAEHA